MSKLYPCVPLLRHDVTAEDQNTDQAAPKKSFQSVSRNPTDQCFERRPIFLSAFMHAHHAYVL